MASWGAEGPRYGSIMGLFKLIVHNPKDCPNSALPVRCRRAIVLFLQATGEHSIFGWIFDELDQVVAAAVSLCSNLFSAKSVTRSGLTLFLTVAYVYEPGRGLPEMAGTPRGKIQNNPIQGRSYRKRPELS
jgi:hypothetical protein